MRTRRAKCGVLLVAAVCFTASACLYLSLTPDSELGEETAGGSEEPPVYDQPDWSLVSAAAEEEQDQMAEASCSLRNAVSSDVLLQQKFNFSVPLLQSARSLSRRSWEQLDTQAPPYGWKGLPVDVVQSALSLLNSSHLFSRDSPGRCIRCAVVGNGGILRGSRQGANIDSHDFVFRMNGAVIKGFEEDVGTKTSFYGFTTNTMKHALSWYRRDGFTSIPQGPDTKYIFIPSNHRDYMMIAAALRGQTVSAGKDKGDRPWRYFGRAPPARFRFLHPGFISYVTRSFLSSRHMKNARTGHLYMPSTGALMLLSALHTCDQVSAYGFITKNYAAFSDHYYDSRRKPLRFFVNHDLRMESRLWEMLHRRRVLQLYQRVEGS